MRLCPNCRLKTLEPVCPVDGFPTVSAALYQEDEVDPLLGTIFVDRYRVESILGKGGFGAVYKATQLAMNRTVALKALRPELAKDLKEVARFQQEARAIASLNHPNIIAVYDFGQAANGSLFLVMELLDGEPLSTIIKREAPLDPRRVVHLTKQVVDALAEAHAKAIIHRDLKPENLYVCQTERKRDLVKVLDWGIAKVYGEGKAEMTLTATGMAIGSPRYMSPEQARAKPVTAQSDLYSLAVIVYHMLTGHPVFEGGSPTETLLAHLTERPPQPTLPDGRVLAGPLVDLVMSCLAKEPAERPGSADVLLSALERAERAPVTYLGEAGLTADPGDAHTQAVVVDGPRAPAVDDHAPTMKVDSQRDLAAAAAAPRSSTSGHLKRVGVRTGEVVAPRAVSGSTPLPAPVSAPVSAPVQAVGAAKPGTSVMPSHPELPLVPNAETAPTWAREVAAAPLAAPMDPSFEEPAPNRRKVLFFAAAGGLLVGGLAIALVIGPSEPPPTTDPPPAVAPAPDERRPKEKLGEEVSPKPTATARPLEPPPVTQRPAAPPEPKVAAPAGPQATEPATGPTAGTLPVAQPVVALKAPEPEVAKVPEPPPPRRVKILTEPPGAQVLRDGSQLGVTPYEVVWPHGGTAPTLTVRLKKYEEQALALTDADDGATKELKLKKKKASGGGTSFGTVD